MVKAIFVAAWLLILTGAQGHAIANQDLLIEAELIPRQLYVQAQAVYRLRFYQGVDVRDLRMLGPSARLAEIRPMGEGRVFEAERAGRRYRVHERSYAVLPFASGPLALTGAQVMGSAIGRQAMPLLAPTMTLDVLPAPAGAEHAPWVPARSLVLSERWLSRPEFLQLGKAVRRSVRVEAGGVDAAQIPQLQLEVPGMMVHVESVRLENRASGNLNVGIREQVFSLVPLVARPLTVPELRLTWWNVAADAPAVAILPARTLQVAAAPNAAQPAAGLSRPVPRQIASTTWRPYGLAILAALTLALVLALLWRRRGRVQSWWRLLQASRAGDVGATRDALLTWARCHWPETPPMTLAALADRVQDQEARRALADMEHALYGRDPCQGYAAWLPAAVQQVRRSIRAAGRRARWHNGRVCQQSSRA